MITFPNTIALSFVWLSLSLFAGSDSLQPGTKNSPATAAFSESKKIYKFDLKREIDPAAWRQADEAFTEAEKMSADYVLIHMNTYGGMLEPMDSIRTRILRCRVPVLCFIDDNAASAGALIAIACDSIYMSSHATIGAATAVDQEGKPVAEKYQSYMRSRLRSTAEQSHRDPRIAEAMNDPRVVIPGVNDSGKVLTFTTSEAIKNNYCEGQAENIDEVLKLAGIKKYEITAYRPTVIGKIIDFFINPVVSGILIMIIIAGIYFELQTPGVGFPLFAAITAAILYFAPLYLEGLAEHWEIIVFVVGLILLGIEIFVTPGFGVLGSVGIIFMVLGLSLSLVQSIPSDSPVDLPDTKGFLKALFIVVGAITVSIAASFFFGEKFFGTNIFKKVALTAVQQTSEGFIGADVAGKSLVGKKGTAFTILRPSGKVEIEGEIYDATADTGYIEKGESVEVVKYLTAQLFVRKVTH